MKYTQSHRRLLWISIMLCKRMLNSIIKSFDMIFIFDYDNTIVGVLIIFYYLSFYYIYLTLRNK